MIFSTLLAQIENPVLDTSVGSGDGGPALAITIANLWRTLLIVGGIATFLYLVWGGISWLMAGGDKDRVESAKNRITNAIIGLGLMVASVAISIIVSQALNFNILEPVFPTP